MYIIHVCMHVFIITSGQSVNWTLSCSQSIRLFVNFCVCKMNVLNTHLHNYIYEHSYGFRQG